MYIKTNACLLLILNFIYYTTGAHILAYFPVPAMSHQIVLRPLTQELARRGHKIVIITTDPEFSKDRVPQNITEIDVHNISYSIWRDFLENQVSKVSKTKAMRAVYYVLSDIIDKQIQSEEVKALITRKEKFDLLLLEANVHHSLEMTHIFKAPTIQLSSFGAINTNYEVQGVPQHVLMYPLFWRTRIYNLTLWEKIQEIYEDFMIRYHLWKSYEDYNKILKKRWGSNAPTLRELANNVDMLFLNVHPLWEGNTPVPPGVIHFNALHLKPEKKLPEDLKTYLDSSVRGIIYMSLGSNVKPSFFPTERINVLMKVFSRLPYNILLKWDKDFPNPPINVKTYKWFPQSDLLRHPKIKLFITQGGLQSTDEAIAAGVPLIVLPIVGDQWYNAEKCVYHKIGRQLDIATITEDTLEESIKIVINDESYRRNMITLRTLMYDQPQTSLDRAVWWTEYVIRHRGAKHYRSPAADITWNEFLMLDITFTLLLGSVVTLLSIIALLTYVTKRISGYVFVESKIKIN